MFYSHEVLTSRKYGVATVWLVATLGSKSTLKRVSRKAILDVDVEKACATIVEPEAPMALRLQSNLLYGVARVYSQQCGYVLSDAEAAKNNMRMMFKVMRTSALEAEGGHKGRADQLVLQDDPNFLPDFDLVPVDLDQFNFDVSTTAAEDSQRSTLSPYNSQITNGSQHTLPNINIPGRSSSLIGGPVGGYGGSFGIRGDSGRGARHDELILDDVLDMDILPDGTIHFNDTPARQPAGPVGRMDRTDPGSVSSKVRRDHEGVQPGSNLLGLPDDDGFMPLQDDFAYGMEAEAFPPRAENGQPQQHTTHTTSESAEAPARRRDKPVPKVIQVDSTMELRNGDLARWNTEYVANMREARRHKEVHRLATNAKENARYWVLGDLGALGRADTLIRGPLDMFSGAKLLEALTGFDLVGGEKRGRAETDEGEDDRRKRSRGLEPSSDELGRGFQYDDGYMPMGEDEYTGVEQGREAPTPLDDRHASSMFPWNQSTGSRRPTGIFTSASLPGVGGAPLGPLSRRGSRLPTASPLGGRGLPGAAGGDIGEFQEGLYSDQAGGGGDIDMGLDDFELYGPAAQVDTQTAGQSQWQRAALDGESVNFFDFVQAAITEIDDARAQAGFGDEEDEALQGSIDFEVLLPPESNTCIVAAQGLLHVLALGTKNLLAIEQAEAFGPINMRAVTV